MFVIILLLVLLSISDSCTMLPTHSQSSHKERRSFIVALVRHLPTEANKNHMSHGSSGGTLTPEASMQSMGTLNLFGRTFGGSLKGLYCGTDLRHYATMHTIAKGAGISESSIQKCANFDEVDIGQLKGMPEYEIMASGEFHRLLCDRDYKIPNLDGQTYGESLNEVDKRVGEGLSHVVRAGCRQGDGIYVICSSRMTLNVAMQRLTAISKFVHPNIPNCGAYFFKYIADGDELSKDYVLNPNNFVLLNSSPVELSGTVPILNLDRYKQDVFGQMAASFQANVPVSVTPKLDASGAVSIHSSSSLKIQDDDLGSSSSSVDSNMTCEYDDSDISSDDEDMDKLNETQHNVCVEIKMSSNQKYVRVMSVPTICVNVRHVLSDGNRSDSDAESYVSSQSF